LRRYRDFKNDLQMKIVIIGAGAAGISAAETIRKKKSDWEIDLVSDEEFLPYYRPRLIDLLAGKAEKEGIYIHKGGWYKENNIFLHLSKKIVGIDIGNKKVVFADSTQLEYDKLLIATGSYPNSPPIPGVNTEGVFTVRTIRDVLDIREQVKNKRSAVVIGGGLLGLESANSLRQSGLDVTVVEHSPYILHRQIDEEGSVFLKDCLEKIGIRLLSGCDTKSISKGDDSIGIVISGANETESSVADIILVSAGIKIDLSLVRGKGINTNNGIIVNDNLETNIRGIFAAGDVSEHRGIIYGLWTTALEQGRIAGENIADGSVVYTGTTPFTKLKVVGIDLVTLGDIKDKESKEFKITDKLKNIYKKKFVKNGIVVGAILLGDTGKMTQIQKLIKEKTNVSGQEQNLLS